MIDSRVEWVFKDMQKQLKRPGDVLGLGDADTDQDLCSSTSPTPKPTRNCARQAR